MTPAAAACRARSNAAKLHARGSLARRVLCLGVVVAELTGCLIPTPLTQKPGVDDSRPNILPGLCAPPFDTTIVHSDGDNFSFTVVAADVDLGDSLIARLFANPTGAATYTLFPPLDAPLLPSSVDDPTQRSVTFGPLDYCGVFRPTVHPMSVKVVVSDRPFPSDNTIDDLNFVDSIVWSLSCN